METISVTYLRANMKSVLDRVVAEKVRVAVTRRKGEGVVIVAASEWATIEKMLCGGRQSGSQER